MSPKVSYGYLPVQLDPVKPLGSAILREWTQELKHGAFTLGPAVERLERAWAETCGTKYAVGVNSGTDALIIAMKALGVGPGDEVITCPNTFVATVGAIRAVGAKPVFVDAGPDYLIDQTWLSNAITQQTKVFMPVDLTGNPVNTGMGIWRGIVIRDACQSIGATFGGVSSGWASDLAAYSLHPLKNIHACGDGGMIVTNENTLAEFARLYRNHGLKDRDTVVMPGINSRLDTLQAIAGWHMLQRLEEITGARIANARVYDVGLAGISQVTIPPRPGPHIRQVFHTYVIEVEDRTALQADLFAHGIETKINYPVPIHLQPGYAYLGYKRGDFPNVERQAERILSLPIHEYLTREQIDYVVEMIHGFYTNEYSP